MVYNTRTGFVEKILDCWRVNKHVPPKQGQRYGLGASGWCSNVILLTVVAVISPTLATGQISSKAYRVLGQVDLTRNGLNRVQGNRDVVACGTRY